MTVINIGEKIEKITETTDPEKRKKGEKEMPVELRVRAITTEKLLLGGYEINHSELGIVRFHCHKDTENPDGSIEMTFDSVDDQQHHGRIVVDIQKDPKQFLRPQQYTAIMRIQEFPRGREKSFAAISIQLISEVLRTLGVATLNVTFFYDSSPKELRTFDPESILDLERKARVDQSRQKHGNQLNEPSHYFTCETKRALGGYEYVTHSIPLNK